MKSAASCTAAAVNKFNRAAEITGINLSCPGNSAELQAACLKFARSDVRLALREGEICIAKTKIGNLFVRRTGEKTVSVTYIKDMRVSLEATVIVDGTIAEVAPVIAGLFETGTQNA